MLTVWLQPERLKGSAPVQDSEGKGRPNNRCNADAELDGQQGCIGGASGGPAAPACVGGAAAGEEEHEACEVRNN